MDAVIEMLSAIGVSAFASHAAAMKLREIMERNP
jgi:hypothetical protein